MTVAIFMLWPGVKRELWVRPFFASSLKDSISYSKPLIRKGDENSSCVLPVSRVKEVRF